MAMVHWWMNWRMAAVPAAVALGLGLLTAQAGAVSAPLPTGATIPLPATTAAAEPDLAGTVVQDNVISFQIQNAAHTQVLCAGQLQNRVVRSTATQDMHFYYRFLPTVHRPEPRALVTHIERIETVFFSGVDPLRAAFRTDGLGVIPPNQVRRPYDNDVWFVFNSPGLTCGEGTRFFFVKTSGRGFKTVGEVRIFLTSGDMVLINNTLMPTAY